MSKLPALTAEDFDLGGGYVHRGIRLIEDEWGSYVFSYGHHDKSEYALAVNEYDSEIGGVTEDTPGYVASEVEHRYAITVEPPPEWLMNWGDATADTPNSFPVTVVSR